MGQPLACEELGVMAIALTAVRQQRPQRPETTSCEQKVMAWWETSKIDDSETPTVH